MTASVQRGEGGHMLDRLMIGLFLLVMAFPEEAGPINGWRVAAMIVAAIFVAALFWNRDKTSSIGRTIPPDRRLTRNLNGIKDLEKK